MNSGSTNTPVPILGGLEVLAERGFDVLYVSHAQAILDKDFPQALEELAVALSELSLPITEIIGSGGGVTKFTQRLRDHLHSLGWLKHEFVISKVVDGITRESTSHEVDHVRRFENGVIACEIEWNNKDPFFDRDLENFKRLHVEGAISVGVLITRGTTLQNSLHEAVRRFANDRKLDGLQSLEAHGIPLTKPQRNNVMRRVERRKDPLPFADAWADMFFGSKYGQATTHWEKLMVRVRRGVGNPCPLLLIGLPASMVVFDTALVEALPETDSEPDT